MYTSDLSCLYILIIAALLGIIPAAIAHSKGKSFIEWWFFGVILFIVALPLAIIAKPETTILDQRKIQQGDSKKCPYCAEIIKREATVCRYCGRDLPTISSLVSDIQSIIPLTKEDSIPPEESQKWRQAFQTLGWYESIGSNTQKALERLSESLDSSKERLICVVYADTSGTHITTVHIGNQKLQSNYMALIATDRRLLIVEPDRQSVFSFRHKDMSLSGGSQAPNSKVSGNEAFYELRTSDGIPISIGVFIDSTVAEKAKTLLDNFFARISR